MISQRMAKISLIFNGILSLACMGLLIYALLQKTVAGVQTTIAIENKLIADSLSVVTIQQAEIAEKQRQLAESAMVQANLQRELAQKKSDSLTFENQNKPQ